MQNRTTIFSLLMLNIITSMRGQSFQEFVENLHSFPDSLSQARLAEDFFSTRTLPIVENDRVHFIYKGAGSEIAVPGDMNGWNPSNSKMEKLGQTTFFFKTYQIPRGGRVEYKVWVDGKWMLDSSNLRKARGGYGENSEIWLPGYLPPEEIEYVANTPHGRIDTLWIRSKYLKRKYPIFVYVPPERPESNRSPVIYVTDGGEYMTFGRTTTILDNLLASGKIQSLIAVFLDPRTDLADASSNRRMSDYAADDRFLDFVEKEVAPYVEKRYSCSHEPRERLIMGASMGGLISTYFVLSRPRFVLNCVAQSPAYLQADSAVIKKIRRLRKATGNFYIDTGTIHDTQSESQLVKTLLEEKGAQVQFAEYPEGHNWANWRARISIFLHYFFPRETRNHVGLPERSP